MGRLLEIENLRVEYPGVEPDRSVLAVDGLTLGLERG